MHAGGRVLVIDDNEANRDVLQRRLSRRGLNVVTREGGRQGLALLERERVDLVLLDVMMPEMSGLEVLSVIRSRWNMHQLPVLMVTALNDTGDVVEALELGANDYITKPIDYPVLLARVRNHLTLKQLADLKDEFLRMASHDLKNPLQGVSGSALLLEALVPLGAPMSEDGAELVATIKAAGGRMQDIIEDFLEDRREGAGPVHSAAVQLNDVVGSIARIEEPYARQKEVSLITELSADLPLVTGTSSRLAQLVQNLVGNAVKFSPPGTVTTVTTSASDAWIVLSVSDQGPGFSDEDLSRVFTPFARLSNKPTGSESSSGLGLSIIKRVVDMHGGEIEVRNNSPEPGCTFEVRLRPC